MTVLVVGGGITGLAAAHALATAGVDVTLAESSERLGGKISTERVDGLLIEHGPDAILTARPAGVALCAELGLAADLVPPLAPDTVYVWHAGRLVPVPAGVGSGLPTRLRPFLASGLFTPLEKLRAALEALVPRETAVGDISVGAFLRRRFGDATVERLLGPLVSAVYGAGVDELSLDALMPRLREAERRHGSLVRAGLAARGAVRAPGPGLVTLARGMGSLVDALVARLGRTNILRGVRVDRIDRAGTRYHAWSADGSRIEADAIVLAAPAPVAARALAALAPDAASALAGIAYRSTAAVTLAYARDQVSRRPDGHGFVAADGALPVAACTWSSAKWPGRAGPDTVLVRATVRAEELVALNDADLIVAVRSSLARAIGARGAPGLARVTRWPGAMPRYTVGHLGRVEHATAALAAHPGLVLAGAAYRGSGVPDCIAQATAAAGRIIEMGRAA